MRRLYVKNRRCGKVYYAQLVTLNGTVCTDVSKQLSEGDVFSVRGKGKFVLQCIGETGRKGNIHITVKKYI